MSQALNSVAKVLFLSALMTSLPPAIAGGRTSHYPQYVPHIQGTAQWGARRIIELEMNRAEVEMDRAAIAEERQRLRIQASQLKEILDLKEKQYRLQEARHSLATQNSRSYLEILSVSQEKDELSALSQTISQLKAELARITTENARGFLHFPTREQVRNYVQASTKNLDLVKNLYGQKLLGPPIETTSDIRVVREIILLARQAAQIINLLETQQHELSIEQRRELLRSLIYNRGYSYWTTIDPATEQLDWRRPWWRRLLRTDPRDLFELYFFELKRNLNKKSSLHQELNKKDLEMLGPFLDQQIKELQDLLLQSPDPLPSSSVCSDALFIK